jgi:hypothetical protein
MTYQRLNEAFYPKDRLFTPPLRCFTEESLKVGLEDFLECRADTQEWIGVQKSRGLNRL